MLRPNTEGSRASIAVPRRAKRFFFAILACAASLSLLAPAGARQSASPAASSKPPTVSEQAPRPNILLIVSDDHGFGDVSWSDSSVRTPNLEAIAREGARLDRFYAHPICSVTRAALLTGIATLRTGVNNREGLDLRYRLMPQLFREAGYQTWMFGKWHLGGTKDNTRSGPEYLPHHRGFDYFYGFLHGAIGYGDHTRHDTHEVDWQRNGETVTEEGFTTDLLVDDARRLIRERDRTKPFFAYVAFNAVHGPLEPPPSAKDLDRKEKRPILLANIEYMDTAIGRLLKTVDEEGLHESTLVLFLGDNGGQYAQGARNGSLRGEKGETFEGGIRVPAAIRWPSVIKPTGRSEQFMSVMDVLPTLCRAAGVPMAETVVPGGEGTPIDGIDLWPALRQGVALEHPAFVMGTRDPACIRAPWKLIDRKGEPPLLFNIVEDPNETKDLAAEHPEVVAELSKLIRAMEGTSGKDGKAKDGRKGGKKGDPKGDKGGPPNGQGGGKKRSKSESEAERDPAKEDR